MRIGRIAIVAVGVGATTAVLGAAVMGGAVDQRAQAAGGIGCTPNLTNTTGVSVAGMSQTQLGNATAVISAGKSANLPPHGWVIALATALQESGLRNLANAAVPDSLRYPHDGQGADHDSVGVFQQRPNWGSVAVRMTVTRSAALFYAALAKVSGWQQLDVTVAAQRVQNSAFPDAYAKWTDLAGQLVGKLADVADLSNCEDLSSQPISTQRASIVDAARSQIGQPYVWAAGDMHGPTRGLAGCDSAAIGGCAAVGFDCSGLALYAWAKVGIHLQHLAAGQYTEGRQVPVAQAQPGDLLFWATNPSQPGSIHHVAIYIGGNQMIEAPQSGERVHLTPVRHDNELMPRAVQPVVSR